MIYLREKIKKVVSNEDDLNKIMDYVYWEISKLKGETPNSTDNKVNLYLKTCFIKK